MTPEESSKRTKLNATQVAHALNRLKSIFDSKTERVIASSSANVYSVIDWANKKQVASFISRYKLPEPTFAEFVSSQFGGPYHMALNVKINAALEKEVEIRRASMKTTYYQANALFAAAQDQMIYNLASVEDVPTVLSKFEEDLSALII